MPIINETALVLLALNAVAGRHHEDFAQKNAHPAKVPVKQAAMQDVPLPLGQTEESDSFATESLDMVAGIYHEFMRPEISPCKGLGKAVRKKNEEQGKEAQAKKQAEKLERLAQKNARALIKAPSKAVWMNAKKAHRGQRHK